MNEDLTSDRKRLKKKNEAISKNLNIDSYLNRPSSKDNSIDNDNEHANNESKYYSEENSVVESEEKGNISEEDLNDYGFYNIMQNENKKDSPYIESQENNDYGVLKTINQGFKLDGKKANDKVYKNCKKITTIANLIEHFATINNDYSDIIIPNARRKENLNRKEEDIYSINPVDDSKIKNEKLGGTVTSNRHKDTIYLNTNNSFILNDQRRLLMNDDLDNAKLLNLDYQKKKLIYEANLVESLIEKYQSSKEVTFVKSFLNLKNLTTKYRIELKKIKDNYNNYSKEKLKDICEQGKSYLETFIKDLHKEITEKTKSNEYEKNYEKWKFKLSELFNIWDLNTKEGIQVKFSHKYLLLKKFITRKSYMQQNGIDFVKEQKDNTNILSKLFSTQLKMLGIGEKASFSSATGIIYYTDMNKILFDIIFAITLIYSYITVPLRIFMGYNSVMYERIEKYVDLVFYIDIVCNFRTVYTDKFNETVKDVNKITKQYVTSLFFTDFISSVPWHLLFIGNSNSYKTVKALVNCLKLFRIIKLAPVFEKINEIKSIANWFKLIRLFVVFFFMAHWSACIMYSTINSSINWQNMAPECYSTSISKTKENLKFDCRFALLFYNGSYFISGQITENVTIKNQLHPTSEYVFLIIDFIIGQILSAYIFGGMASVIQSLNDGEKLFTDKLDIINGHMLFYGVSSEVVNGVKIYYDYLWQRHKDLISGKSNFYLLSKSLREKFEQINLPGNEIYLAKFFNLNTGSSKLVGNILMGLEKLIIFPFEILFEEKSITKGLYILLNGDVELSNKNIQNVLKEEYKVEMGEVLQLSEQLKKNEGPRSFDESQSHIFPLVPAFIKTGRNYQRCFSKHFTDLLFLPLEKFDQILLNFPIEMHVLRHNIMSEVSRSKLFENKSLFECISSHSSRSTGKYFEKEFNKLSIWIPIPIPISQRKIAKNFMKSFMSKVRNQWKEIIITGDMNINLNSHKIVSIISQKELKNLDFTVNKNLSNVEKIKVMVRNLNSIGSFYQEYVEKLNNFGNEAYESEDRNDDGEFCDDI